MLVRAMDAARATRNARLAEADALLAGMDPFVLQELGIKRDTPQRYTFARQLRDLKESRLDTDYHSLRFRIIRNEIENGYYPTGTVADICEYITTGFAAGPQDQAAGYENDISHLRPLNLDTQGQLSLVGTKFVPTFAASAKDQCVSGEVLFNNTNSTSEVGKCAVFDLKQACACSNHITRLMPRTGINAQYVTGAFNALRSIGYLGLLSTNFNNQAGINIAVLSRLHLPTPPSQEQDRIASEITRRRLEARWLREGAEADWLEAKRWFEQQLLDG